MNDAGQAAGNAANDAGAAVGNAANDAGQVADEAVDETTDNNFSDGDWGLLGLLGLFGLFGRRKRTVTAYEDPAVRSTTTNRY
ncbi:WGxxGxxG-CTERM domain-containing protein [Microcoleus sp. FACHB-1515]|nr:WGxxGxxG-CTERM domain-containing protein [Microcoleus sp. FACHB-1515]